MSGDGKVTRRRTRLESTALNLTERERQILRLLAEGYSNKEVAAAACITVRTAETHRANIRRKLNLHSLADLIRYALQHGIAEL